MKRIALVLISLFCLVGGAMAQQSVAVMDVKVLEGTVSIMNKIQVRSALEKGITQSPGYKAYNRTALDRIAKELAFQRSGEVSDDQIRELGKKAGVDYILTTEVAKSGNNMFVSVNVLNIETGEYDNSDNTLIVDASDENIQSKCIELAQSLFGGNSSSSSGSSKKTVASAPSKPSVPAGYTDLGLPSGTYWKNFNATGFFTYDEAVSQFGNRLPTKEQWNELKAECQWTWTGSGYKVTGPNGNSIDLPAAGFRNCDGGGVDDVGSNGMYWSSTPAGSSIACSLDFDSSEVSMYYANRCIGRSVRLVQ